jgi:hypothetical protein
MRSNIRSVAPDGRVPIRARVSPTTLSALTDEASHRRVSVSVLLDRVLADTLPRLAQERVRESIGEPKEVDDDPELVS